MSTVFVDTIKNQAGTTSLAANKLPDMLSGSAKAWCDWDGTGTAAINKSLNISSLTDQGTGDQQVNFTNSFTTNGFSLGANGNQTRNSTGWCWLVTDHQRTTALSRVRASTAAYTLTDLAVMNVGIHGDLA